ncbi:leucine-rich repeat domain-containing protein [Kordia sp.]|uniref:leucine-rich repeat domain-containing protein n=1 Tax=Kordia sp. TaxID=1965332 RepID=UPI003B593626
MNRIKNTIKIIENNLGISLKAFPHASGIDQQYFIHKGKLRFLEFHELHFENLDALKPVFQIVKRLIFYDCTFNTNTIVEGFKQFTALEHVVVNITEDTNLTTADSILTVQAFLQLENLKELEILIDYEKLPANTVILDFKELKNIERLRIHSYNVNSDKMIVFKGAEYLTKLKKLELECDCMIADLNKFKKLQHLCTESFHLQITDKLKTLKTLEISVLKDDYSIYSLEQFPNLENLKISSCNSIQLGKLEKLKRLVLSPGDDLEDATRFDQLPNLEELELHLSDSAEIKNLDKLTNLKSLNFGYENGVPSKITNIDGLKNLKQLEYLNLYNNNISDISVLNELPNLKEVNLGCNDITEEDAKKQLKKPVVLYFSGLPVRPKTNVPWGIWGNID